MSDPSPFANAMDSGSTPTPTAAQRPSPMEAAETLRTLGQSQPPSFIRHDNNNDNDHNSTSSGSSRKIERSCNLCHRRKIRCDKKFPCSSCARGGFPCHYPQAGQPIRRARKTTIADVASRISDLERTLGAGVVRELFRSSPAGPTTTMATTTTTTAPSSSATTSAFLPSLNPSRPHVTVSPSGPHEKGSGDEILLRKGSSSQYFDEVLISRVIEEEHEIQSVLTTPRSGPAPPTAPSPFNPMGILSSPNLNSDLTEFLPPKWGAIELWRNYNDNIAPCNKIIHIPTAEVLIFTAINDPRTAPTEALALMFSIFFVSTVVLDADTVQIYTGDDKITSLHRFKTGLEQAFAKADILEHPSVRLLEALAIYLVALRINNAGRGLWTLNGLAIRAAQSIGLHRDGTRLGLSPFESEIRRRLWWHLLARDGRAAEDYGIQNPTSFNLNVGVSFPSNLDDNDLYPEMKELPPPRPGWTQMTLQLINIQIARAWHRLAQMASAWHENPTPESVRAQIVDELREYAEGFLGHCNAVIPHQRHTLVVTRFIIRKVDLVTRHQWFNLEHPEARDSFASDENLEQAVGVLESGASFVADELLRPFRWSLRSYPQYHMLLYVLWHLCLKPQGPNVERAWRAADDALDQLRHVGPGYVPAAKLTVLDALRAKAFAIRQRLGHQQQQYQQQPQQNNVHVGASAAAAAAGGDKEGYPTPVGTDDRSDVDGPENVMDETGDVVGGIDWGHALQDFPDWNALMTGFQVDGSEFPNYLS